MKTLWPAALCLILAGPSLLRGDSLGEAAKREQDRRKKLEDSGSTPSRVISQDDLPPSEKKAAGPGAPTSETESARRPVTFIGGPMGSAGGDDPSSWATRRRALEADVQTAERELEEAKSRQARYYVRMGERIPLDNNPQKLQAAQARLEAARQALVALEEDARRRGIPPGWLRGQVESHGNDGALEPEVRGTSEAQWRQRANAARSDLASAQRAYEAAQKETVWSGGTLYNDDVRGEALARAMGTVKRKQDEAKRRLDTATQTLADLEEEARRSGIPPGWVR
jgi:hypothetical protein